MPNTPRLQGTPPPGGGLGDTHTAWARGRLAKISAELRDLVARTARSLPGTRPFDDGPTYGVEGLFKFHLDDERAVLWFELMARPVDAMYFEVGVRGFVVRSDPSRPLDPLGYLRGQVLEIVSAAGGGRFSSLPPAATPLPSPRPEKPRRG